MIFDQPALQLDMVPDSPGVYRFTDAEGRLLYVGKAKNLSTRVRAYFEGREHGPHIKMMATHIHQMEVLTTATELDALLLEQRLIHQAKPKYNIIFRDDKTYAYIALSKHEFPQIKTFRGKRSHDQTLFGPFTDSKSSRARIELLQKTFQIRTCDDSTFANRSRPCVLHQIGRCSAPCMPELANKKEYADAIAKTKSYLTGKDSALVASLTQEMNLASDAMNYEQAGKIRDQIRIISNAGTEQRFEGAADANLDAIGIASGTTTSSIQVNSIRNGVISDVVAYELPTPCSGQDELEALISQHYLERPPPEKIIMNHDRQSDDMADFVAAKWGTRCSIARPANTAEQAWLDQASLNAAQSLSQKETPTAIRELQQHKLVEIFPGIAKFQLKRIECFDISHFQGESAVASCVVYNEFEMRPELYRIFNIAPEHAGDDFASMKEALIRRYQTSDVNDRPQLIIIDGGLGQMGKAQEALALIGLDIPMIGIAKGATRKLGNEELICTWGDPSRRLDKSHPALLLLSHIRDESHRFAITRNRKNVAKKRTQSELLLIPGVGPNKRKALLLAFGSAREIARASSEQIQQVPGIGAALAKSIKEHLEAKFA